MKITVIVPTIDGRETNLAQCMEGYLHNSAHTIDLKVYRNRPACGIVWQEGADEIEDTDYVHFTADDLYPLPGWDEAAITTVDRGCLPAPRITRPDGTLDYCGKWNVELPDWQEVEMSTIPFMSWEMWKKIGPMPPEMHYYTDNWISWRGAQAGIKTVVARGFAFTHSWAMPGRYGNERMELDREKFEEAKKQVEAGEWPITI